MNEAMDDCWNHKGVRGDRSCERLAVHTHCRNCEVHSAAAGRIMQRALPDGYRREWAEHFAREEQTHRETDQASLVFRIGREWLALPASASITVAEPSAPRRLPHRSGAVLTGIVSIRGRLYPCMSLAGLLDIDASQQPDQAGPRTYPRLLAVRLQQQAFALPVDALHGIHRHAETDLQEPAPANRVLYRYISGVLRIEQMLVGCLDPELLGYKLASVLK